MAAMFKVLCRIPTFPPSLEESRLVWGEACRTQEKDCHAQHYHLLSDGLSPPFVQKGQGAVIRQSQAGKRPETRCFYVKVNQGGQRICLEKPTGKPTLTSPLPAPLGLPRSYSRAPIFPILTIPYSLR